MNNTQTLFLTLLRAAIWGEKPDASLFVGAEWKAILSLADTQTVQVLLLDGMSMLPPELLRIDTGEKLRRIAQMRQVERINGSHRSVIARIVDALGAEGIPCVFMKGQTTALRYPNPLHRMPGDIDFVVAPGDFRRTMAVMERMGSVDHGLVHEHHGMAWIDGATVEPHYKVHNYQRPSTDRAMRDMFSAVFPDNLSWAEMDGNRVAIFPPTFESVFLVSHMVNHVYEEGLGLRQVIDYAMFLRACADRIDWARHGEYLRKMRMERAWRIFTCVCVRYLGLPMPSAVSPFSAREESWASRMMYDIMRVGNFGRGEYEFRHCGMMDAWRNYRWVATRCLRLGFVCPSEAGWWLVAKVARYFWKKSRE